MNIKNIQALAQIMDKSGLTAIEVLEGETKIRLEKNITQTMQSSAVMAPIVEQKAAVQQSTPEINQVAVDFNNVKEIKSPMVGVFYAAPTPDAAPFVKVGDKVKKGDTLCIIEAMKLMNEITAELDGEIVDICVSNGQVVEFSQSLFKIF